MLWFFMCLNMYSYILQSESFDGLRPAFSLNVCQCYADSFLLKVGARSATVVFNFHTSELYCCQFQYCNFWSNRVFAFCLNLYFVHLMTSRVIRKRLLFNYHKLSYHEIKYLYILFWHCYDHLKIVKSVAFLKKYCCRIFYCMFSNYLKCMTCW